MVAPPKYPVELQERAVRLWRSEQPRRPIAHLARELGVHPQALRNWIRQNEANRNFTTDAPDRLWVADISRIPTGEGPLWLASVRDAFSRRVVGWKASDRADTQLVLGALEYGLWSRQVERERLVFHSDSECVEAGCCWAS